MAGSVETRLAELGLVLPQVMAPLAAYQPAVRHGGMVYTSGQLPLRDGRLLAEGLLGADVDTATGYECAKQCALNALAAVATVADLDEAARVVKVVGFVASTSDFAEQHLVINGASELLAGVLGDAGRHARSAVGMASLPLRAPVEVEIVVALR